MPQQAQTFAHFEADFEDGTTYVQGADDSSIDTEGKNSFYDILQREKDVVTFRIVKDDGNTLSVNLHDGHFEVNGVPFFAHPQFTTVKTPLKLIYFKEMHQNFHQGDNEPFEIKVNRYFIGWEGEGTNGKNVKQTIAVV